MQGLGSTTFKPFNLRGNELYPIDITTNKSNMTLTGQSQQTVLDISSYLINLLFNTGVRYNLWFFAYNFIIIKNLTNKM